MLITLEVTMPPSVTTSFVWVERMIAKLADAAMFATNPVIVVRVWEVYTEGPLKPKGKRT